MQELIGKKIVKVGISQDKTVLGFEIEDGSKLAYYTEGDCCSSSWIEHFSNAEYLAGSRVVGVEEIDVPGVGDDEQNDGDFIQCYGVRISLFGKPPFEFEFRNSSNGYYGGCITKHVLDDKGWRELIEICEYEKFMTVQEVIVS